MCIITLQVNDHPKYKLIVAANRDEAYARPTAQAHFWNKAPELLAGQDLKAGGTWLGITKTGKFAAITNYRDIKNIKATFPKSRGDIVTSYLLNQNEPVAFLKDLQAERHLYGGFNLIVGHVDSLYYYSPQHNEIEAIQPGIHSLSNADLNTPWPKVLRAKEKLAQTKTTSNQDVLQALLLQLSDKKKAAAQDLPETGVGLALEKELSPIFIKTKDYGTRLSTALLITHDNHVEFLERTYQAGVNHQEDVHFSFELE